MRQIIDLLYSNARYLKKRISMELKYLSLLGYHYLARNWPGALKSSPLNYSEQLVRVISEKESMSSDAKDNKKIPTRILVDVSHISRIDLGSGIQRVVKELSYQMFMSFPESVIFVSMNSCNLVSANRFTERIFNLPDQDLGTETPIIIQKDDVLLMLDSSWAIYDQFIPYFRCVKKFGGNVVTIIYDLIPIYYPALCAESITDIFENWLRLAIIHSNKFICISQTIAQQFVDYLHTNHIKIDHRLFIHYFHLGANLLRENQKIVNTLIESRKVSDESMFLMVGTIEPRKGHEFVLDVFDELWNQSYSGKLCIAGKFGWNVKNIKDRILDHPFFGKKVLLFENPTDETIQNLYSKSSAVIVASIAEGFGLPIVEAAFHRCPAIMSDIPVFREIGGENGLYFCKNSKSGLKNAIQKIDTLSLHEKNELAECVNLITWSKSAEWFIEEIYSLNPFATFPNN